MQKPWRVRDIILSVIAEGEEITTNEIIQRMKFSGFIEKKTRKTIVQANLSLLLKEKRLERIGNSTYKLMTKEKSNEESQAESSRN